jgi:hypothetical protein
MDLEAYFCGVCCVIVKLDADCQNRDLNKSAQYSSGYKATTTDGNLQQGEIRSDQNEKIH